MPAGMGSITTRVPAAVSTRKHDWPYQLRRAMGAAALAVTMTTGTAATTIPRMIPKTRRPSHSRRTRMLATLTPRRRGRQRRRAGGGHHRPGHTGDGDEAADHRREGEPLAQEQHPTGHRHHH